MCNLYMMYSAAVPTAVGCYSVSRGEAGVENGPVVVQHVQSDELNPFLHGWVPEAGVGQVSGLDFAPDGRSLWLFHRGDRVWDGSTYDEASNRMRSTARIAAAAVRQVDAGSGATLAAFGADTFSMPHGLSTDAWGNVWVTDVGLHQVLKFSPNGSLLLSLGTAFTPGDGPASFCKPTHVAVASDGSFFVADGYCNSRIVAYHADGTYRGEWRGEGLEKGLNTPHALALDECADMLFVADRESGRVVRLSGVLGAAAPSSWRPSGGWAMEAGGDKAGLPYGLMRVPGGALYALVWQRPGMLGFGGGGSRLMLLAGAREGAGWAAPAASWDLPGVSVPHHLAIAPLPGGGPGLGVYVGETRPAGQAAPPASSPSRWALGDALPACVTWPASCSAEQHEETVLRLRSHQHTRPDALRRLGAYLARRKQEGVSH